MAVGAASQFPLTEINGFRLGAAKAGIRYADRLDLVVMELSASSTVAAVFTRNAFYAAPVQIAKDHWNQGNSASRYLLVNTGNANAGNGQDGIQDCLKSCEALAALCDVDVDNILPFSTGVIGEKLPVDELIAGIPAALADLDQSNWERAASGILTTDTRTKGASRTIQHQGQSIKVSGISKGSGMICPNMATMLAYVATDAKVPQALLQQILAHCNEKSFNRISVDGDTSTNDACILVATGKGAVVDSEDSPLYASLLQAVQEVCTELAQAIVRDGEGATKFVEIQVNSALSGAEALQVANTVASSPLVKTALFAADPNWGRILAAVGRAGVTQLDLGKIEIFLGESRIVTQGGRAAEYTEEDGQAALAGDEVCIRIELGRGACQETVWTCDLSHDYVSINADYRS